ncbi:MAG: helix-turn-helix transcriptional regulator [Spirochaetales bacterium]|nr:helix-turn-helix transcriptional regulator [Spirochaetales bacterium]
MIPIIVTWTIAMWPVGITKRKLFLLRYIMLVVEKKHHIKIRIHGKGIKKVIKILKENLPKLEVSETETEDEYVNIEDTEFWKGMQKEKTPGMVLRVYRDNAGLTLQALSEKSGIAKSHLSEMENNKRSIGVKTAKKLAGVLGCNYKRFL